MTEHDQLAAAAELDGYDIICVGIDTPGCFKLMRNGTRLSSHDLRKFAELHFPDYLHSYDAIIPLIQKYLGFGDTLDPDNCEKFWNSLNEQTDFFEQAGHTGMLNATPAQLCEALLRATGKWKD